MHARVLLVSLLVVGMAFATPDSVCVLWVLVQESVGRFCVAC